MLVSHRPGPPRSFQGPTGPGAPWRKKRFPPSRGKAAPLQLRPVPSRRLLRLGSGGPRAQHPRPASRPRTPETSASAALSTSSPASRPPQRGARLPRGSRAYPRPPVPARSPRPPPHAGRSVPDAAQTRGKPASKRHHKTAAFGTELSEAFGSVSPERGRSQLTFVPVVALQFHTRALGTSPPRSEATGGPTRSVGTRPLPAPAPRLESKPASPRRRP